LLVRDRPTSASVLLTPKESAQNDSGYDQQGRTSEPGEYPLPHGHFAAAFFSPLWIRPSVSRSPNTP